MLHVCSCKLRRAVVTRFEAGEIRYNEGLTRRHFIPGSEISNSIAQLLKDAVRLSELRTQSLVGMLSVHSAVFPEFDCLCLEFLVYVCNLAESMGFSLVVSCLERVWGKVVSRGDMLILQEGFREARAQPINTPGFFRRNRDSEAFQSVAGCMSKAEWCMLDGKIAGVLWLVYFLVGFDGMLC